MLKQNQIGYDIYKYPRSPHLPTSPGATEDDKHVTPAGLKNLKSGIELVTTEKMDGGNISLYRDYYHGRSLDSGTHAWETVSKALWANVRHQIPEGWRVSCESLYARRSVSYDHLEGFLYVFGVMDENKQVLGWDMVEMVAKDLGLPLVPVLYRGTDFDEASNVWFNTMDTEKSEGFVVRNANDFPVKRFGENLAKWVRPNHVRTAADWRYRDDFAVNKLAENQ